MLFKTEKIDLREDEVEVDGIIICTKCGTARMFKSDDGTFCTRALCKCQSLQAEKQAQIAQYKEHCNEVKRLSMISVLGPRQMLTFDMLDLNVDISFIRTAERLRTYCDNWKKVRQAGAGFYLYSQTPGNGKTALTACVANALTEKYIPTLMTNMLEISKRLRYAYSTGNQPEYEILQILVSAEFLVIDDLGVERLTKSGEDTFLQERLYDIINRRYNEFKPTAFTSNFTLEQLVKERGLWLRTADRIREMSHAMIELKGTSYRPKMREKIPTLF